MLRKTKQSLVSLAIGVCAMFTAGMSLDIYRTIQLEREHFEKENTCIAKYVASGIPRYKLIRKHGTCYIAE